VGTRLLSESHGGVLFLTLDNEDGLPRLERGVRRQLESEIARLGAERAFAASIITGSERAFAVGADIGELARLTAAEAFEFSREGQRVFQAIERSPKAVVAAIRGYCFGGGLDLALACHARVATADAVFAHPGSALGILTGWGGTQRLTRLIGRARALEMLATGRTIGARKACDFGLVREVVPCERLMANAREIALEIAPARIENCSAV
jgi:enoyl-CoA hydratase